MSRSHQLEGKHALNASTARTTPRLIDVLLTALTIKMPYGKEYMHTLGQLHETLN